MRPEDLSEEPITAWLQMVEARRKDNNSPTTAFLLSAMIAVGPAAFYGLFLGFSVVDWLTSRSPVLGPALPTGWLPNLLGLGGIGAAVSLFLLSASLPVSQAIACGILLVSLRKTRVMEELAGTHLTTGSLVDILARHAAWRTLRGAWAPALLGGLLLLLAGEQAPSLGWVLFPLSLAPALSYGALAVCIWTSTKPAEGGGWLRGLLLSLALALPLLGLIGLAVALVAGSGWLPAFLTTAAAASLGAVLFRLLAQQGLADDSTLRRSLASTPGASARRCQTFSSSTLNAMVYRLEAVSTELPGRRLAVGLFWVPALALVLMQFFGVGWSSALLVAFAFRAGATACAALWETSEGLYRERQRGTEELLFQSGLSTADYVSGCLQAATARRAVGLLQAFLVTATGLVLTHAWKAGVGLVPTHAGEEWAWFLGLALVGWQALPTAAVWGTAVASQSRQRFEPLTVGLTFVTGLAVAAALLFLGLVTCGVCLGALGGFDWASLEFLFPLAALVSLLGGQAMLRKAAWTSSLFTLTQRPGRVGFSSM